MDVWVTQVGTGKFYNLTQGAEDGPRQFIASHPRVHARRHPRDLLAARHRSGRHAHRHLGGPCAGRTAAALSGRCRRSGLVSRRQPPRVPHARTGRSRCSSAMRGNPSRGTSSQPRRGGTATSPSGRRMQAFIYFVHSVEGAVPERMDIWRIRPTGGAPERITHHDSRVTHPVFLDARTLAYLAQRSGWLRPLAPHARRQAACPQPRELRTRELHLARRERRWPASRRNPDESQRRAVAVAARRHADRVDSAHAASH